MGCGQSLQAVTQHVIRIYSENGQDDNLTETAVRNLIIDLAARKSFAAKNSKCLVFKFNMSGHITIYRMTRLLHRAICLSRLLNKQQLGQSSRDKDMKSCISSSQD